MFCLFLLQNETNYFRVERNQKGFFSQPYLQIRNFRRKNCRGCMQETEIATSRPHVRSGIIAVPWLRPTFHRGGPEFNPKNSVLDLFWTRWCWHKALSKHFGVPLSDHCKNDPHSYFKLTSTLQNLNK